MRGAEASAPAPPASGLLILRGGGITAAAQAARILLQLASLVVLARLLTPGDFGLVALMTPIVALLALVQDLGFSTAVTQREHLPPEELDRAFMLLAALGCLGGLGLVAAGPALAWAFAEPRLEALSAAMAPLMLMGGLTALPMALLARGLRFGAIAAIEVGASALGLLGAVVAALAGAGYWALVLSLLLAALATLAGAWAAAGWRPRSFRPGLPGAGFLAFGGNLTGFQLLNWLMRNLDNVLIGRFVGVEALGLYDRAYKLLLFPLQGLVWPMGRVMVPVLSRVQSDRPRIRALYLHAAGLLALLTTPGLAVVAAAPGETVRLLFGPGWEAAAPILFWLSLAGLAQPLNSSTGWLMIAQGRTDAMFRWGGFACATTVGAFAAGLPWGAAGVAAAYAISELLVRLPALYWWVQRIGPVRALDLIRIQAPLLAAAAATILLTGAVLRPALASSGLAVLAAAGALSYALAFAFWLAPRPNRLSLAAGARTGWRALARA